MQPTIAIRQAITGDIPEIGALLKQADLPADDFLPHLALFRVATGARNQVVGVVGLEPCGEHALFRSLVVEPSQRGTGLGIWLTQTALRLAQKKGYKSVWLLTTTAAGFFASQGFHAVERGSAPDKVAATSEFTELCPSSAVCMTRNL